MTRLSELIFINSASFSFSQVQLEGNTLFCGANGVGKTTILRAILYFYSANSKKLGINSSKKKGFGEYYFENINSYIIYKYKNEHGVNYLVLYKTAQFTPIKFRFFSSYEQIDIKSLFLEDGIALSIDKVISKIRADKINISNTINSAKEYRDILYGQTKEYKQYGFLKANTSFNQIHKTISNIFINSKLDSDVIKKSLVSDMEDFIPIDLQNISSNLSRFLDDIEVVEEFEKSDEFIENAISNYNGYFQKEQLLKDEVNKLFASFKYSIKEEKNISEKIELNKQKHKTIQSQKDELKRDHNKKIKRLENQELILKEFIKKSNEKKGFYKSKDIENLLFEESQKPIYETKKGSLEEQINTLKQKGTDEAKSFEILISDKKNKTKQFINQINSDKNKIQSRFLEGKALEDRKKDQESKKLDDQYNPQIEDNKVLVQNIDSEIKDLVSQINFINHQEFLKDELKQQKNLIQKTKDKITSLDLNIQKQKIKIGEYDQDIQKQENNADQKILKEASSYEAFRKEILNDIELFRSRLNISDDSFLQFLIQDKNKHLSKITTLLKDEILFSNTINPKTVDKSNSFYGYELDIKEDMTYDEEYLKEQISIKNKALEDQFKKFEQKKEQINKELKKDISKIYKDKKDLNQSIDEDSKQKITLETKLLKYQNEFETLDKRAKDLKSQKLNSLANIKSKKGLLYEQKKKTLEEIQKEYINKQKSIKSSYSKFINNFTKIKENELTKLDQNKKNLNKELLLEIKELEDLKTKTLLEKGVDTKALNQKEQELLVYKNKLKFIDTNMQVIYGYRNDKEEYLDKLKDKKVELKDCEEDMIKLKNKFMDQCNHLDNDLKILNEDTQKLEQEIKKYQDNIDEYEKIKSGNFYNKIESLFQDGFSIDSFVDISNMQSVLFSIDDERNKKIKNLKSNLNKVFTKFKSNNILNLNLSLSQEKEDVLKSAKELKEFYEENKIKYYKDTLSSTYSMSLSTYTEQISNLLDASGKIKTTISKINQNLKNLQNINVIQKVELQHQESDNKIVQILKELKDEYNNNSFVNEVNLFNPLGADNGFNNRILKLFSRLSEYLFEFNKKDILDLEDSFILEFRAIENGHDTGFVSVLDDIGSNGTDVMIKAMVYIAMLNLSRKSAQKDKDEEIFLHCILDEIGILSPRYLKELITFANSQKIEFLNGAPDEKIVTTYKRVYLLNTTPNHKTMVNEIIAQI